MLNSVVELAVLAGQEIMQFYKTGKDLGVQSKSDDSPVTLADIAAHKVIEAGLQKLDPHTPLLSEEGTIPKYEDRKHWDAFWCVDPLDGTKEFINQTEEFTVNIARLVANQPILGVIYSPARDLLYYGQVGKGAWKKEGDNDPVQIFSEPPNPEGPFRIVHSRSHLDRETEKYIEVQPTSETLGIGSSLKFGLLAESAVDVYPRFGPMMEWDVAAGDAIFRASGRKSPRKSPIQYNKEKLTVETFLLGKDWEL